MTKRSTPSSRPGSQPLFTTLLLDLDGTLLDVEMRAFLEAYFALAAARFGPPAAARRIAQAMAAAARAMTLAADGVRTLDHLFLERLAPAVGLATEELRERLAAFHREEYLRMRRLVRPLPGARAFVERARERGCELVLATNPVFFLEAIEARVRWAGLEDVPFALVTGAELMRWTKPHGGYFAQTLALVGRQPGQCLMVGDHPVSDMAAKEVGIATWLAERPGRPRLEAPLADRRGTLAELAAEL